MKIRHLRNFDELQRKAGDPGPDSDLLKPYLDASSKAEELAKAGNSAMQDELATIKRIVAECRKSHQLNLRKGNNTTLLPSAKKQGKSYQEVVTQTAHEFWARLSLGSTLSEADGDSRRDYMFFWDANLRASVAASYAYYHDMQGGKDGGVYYDGTRWVAASYPPCLKFNASAIPSGSHGVSLFVNCAGSRLRPRVRIRRQSRNSQRPWWCTRSLRQFPSASWSYFSRTVSEW